MSAQTPVTTFSTPTSMCMLHSWSSGCAKNIFTPPLKTHALHANVLIRLCGYCFWVYNPLIWSCALCMHCKHICSMYMGKGEITYPKTQYNYIVQCMYTMLHKVSYIKHVLLWMKLSYSFPKKVKSLYATVYCFVTRVFSVMNLKWYINYYWSMYASKVHYVEKPYWQGAMHNSTALQFYFSQY